MSRVKLPLTPALSNFPSDPQVPIQSFLHPIQCDFSEREAMDGGSSSPLPTVAGATQSSTGMSSPSSTPTSFPGAAPPPPGVTPNLENPSDQGHNANIVGLSVCISFATIFYFMRVYVKLRITRRIFLEDGEQERRYAWASRRKVLMTRQ